MKDICKPKFISQIEINKLRLLKKRIEVTSQLPPMTLSYGKSEKVIPHVMASQRMITEATVSIVPNCSRCLCCTAPAGGQMIFCSLLLVPSVDCLLF